MGIFLHIAQVQKLQLLGDLGALLIHHVLKRSVGVQRGQSQVGEVAQRFQQKMTATTGIVQNFEVHECAAVSVAAGCGCGNGMVHAGLDQGLREHRLGVVAGSCFAGVAGAFKKYIAFFHADIAP